MKRLFTKLAASVGLFALFLVPLAVPATVGAQGVQFEENLCAGANFSVTPQNCDSGAAESSVESIITTVINIFSLVVGFVSVIMIIIGGFKYITSGGNEGSVSGAKNTILFAIVGLVIVALAQVIVQFVLSQATENL